MVVAITGALLFLGLVMGFDTLKNYARRSEREVVVTVLTKARSRAMNNIGQSPHGVCLDASDYVIFRGTQYRAGVSPQEKIPGNLRSSPFGLPACDSGAIIFSQLAGTTSPAIVRITEGGIVSVVEINAQGRINEN